MLLGTTIANIGSFPVTSLDSKIEGAVHKFIHRHLGLQCSDDLHSEVSNALQSLLLDEINPVKWFIERMREINNKESNPSCELSKLLSALNPYLGQLQSDLPIVQYIQCIANLPAPSSMPVPHLETDSIKAEWVRFMTNKCLDWNCRGACASDFPYAFAQSDTQLEPLEALMPEIEPAAPPNPQSDARTKQTASSASPNYSSSSSYSPYKNEEPIPELDDSACACGTDHSSTQSNVDQGTQVSSNPTSSAKQPSQPSFSGNSSTRPTKPTSSGSSVGNDGSGGGGSHSCGDPGCNIDHGKKVETPELPHNPNVCTDENCTIDHNLSA
ncbi:MAG: hypothetical protein ACK481_00715, partial [Candidatus Melainabacteria bacterium]